MINEEIRFRAKSGEIRTMLFSAEIVTITGRPCLLAVNVDITERIETQDIIRRQNEELVASNEEFEAMNEERVKSQQELSVAHELLKQSEEKLSTSFRLAPVILTLSRLSDGHYVEVSDYFLELTGYTRDEVIGNTALGLSIWANPEDRQRVLNTIRDRGAIIEEELLFRSKTSDEKIMLFSAEIIRIFDVPHLISVAIDITERKKAERDKDLLEEQLRQAQKMESIGRLAGGVAHDFNNLLTAIMGNTDFALMHLDRIDDVAARLEVVKKAALSAAGLTRQLLAFSRKQIIEPAILDVNDMIEQIHKMLSRLIGENIDLQVQTGATGAILADPGQVEQIIINLAINARDAMSGGGTLIIRTEDASIGDHPRKKHPRVPRGDYVLISVSDNGQGMDEATMNNLFEPFYTTKPKGKGTGMGLAMVYGAVTQNKGVIEVESAPGRGTTVSIMFPRATRDRAPAPAPARHRSILRGSETVLLVEDDDMVRDYAAQVLFRLGYRVFQATSGEDALAFVETCDETIDLVMTDIMLTGMNGRELATRITTMKPGVRVLFTSGYSEDIIAEQGVLKEGIHFIAKPYAAETLAMKVRETLEE